MPPNNLLAVFEIDESEVAPDFKPGWTFMAPLDLLQYLEEGGGYTAFKLTPRLFVLMHPTQGRAIGLTIGGVAQKLLAAPQ